MFAWDKSIRDKLKQFFATGNVLNTVSMLGKKWHLIKISVYCSVDNQKLEINLLSQAQAPESSTKPQTSGNWRRLVGLYAVMVVLTVYCDHCYALNYIERICFLLVLKFIEFCCYNDSCIVKRSDLCYYYTEISENRLQHSCAIKRNLWYIRICPSKSNLCYWNFLYLFSIFLVCIRQKLLARNK